LVALLARSSLGQLALRLELRPQLPWAIRSRSKPRGGASKDGRRIPAGPGAVGARSHREVAKAATELPPDGVLGTTHEQPGQERLCRVCLGSPRTLPRGLGAKVAKPVV